MAKNGNIHPTRIFKQPEDLLIAWEQYKENITTTAEKWEKIQYVGRDGDRKTDNPPMPYSIDGFCRWYYSENRQFIHQYFKRTKELFTDFLPIVTHIEADRNENISTGVLLGHFNSSLGTRIIGIADKTDINNTTNVQLLTVDPLDDSADDSTTEDSELKKED